MCKTKISIGVVTPIPKPRNKSPRPAKSFSNSNFNFNITNEYSTNLFSKSSNNSRASPSSLREALPENPHIYDFSEICSATNNFLSKKFNSSSSSTSWRSTIRGRDVIISQRKLRRSLELQQLCDRLSLIGRSHHSSIIKLLGLNSNVIHNHIKSSSIIITEHVSELPICAKFSHFGTAELCGEVEENRDGKVKKIEGTTGYMSPEFQVSGITTQKSDVYAFGVVILELLSGEEALRWVDRRLKDSYPVEVAEKMVVLGLQCADENPENRPDMGKVADLVSMLYLESKTWAERIGLPTDFSVSLPPR
ncbi:hypothetical protein EZV62_025377 [Acer yangbiense]|uniref:Protein kinase domain-containing protein n=1 Tax=Acer yangbiense TaxID=1000413 RepID=A0A5C7GYV1_9ROSI|nr:hypothetical protein EZV62_025377 [Acer yangbiense]